MGDVLPFWASFSLLANIWGGGVALGLPLPREGLEEDVGGVGIFPGVSAFRDEEELSGLCFAGGPFLRLSDLGAL